MQSKWLTLLVNISSEIDNTISKSGHHSVRVANICQLVAKEFGIRDEDLDTIYWSSIFHDIGKIGIQKEILQKEGPLTSEEWKLMELHPTIGANLVNATQKFGDSVPIIQTHQERFDGRGYPFGIGGETIPLAARILAVVDAYDAMTDDRHYRKGSTHDQAVEEILYYRNQQFDPEVVDTFLEIVDDQKNIDQLEHSLNH